MGDGDVDVAREMAENKLIEALQRILACLAPGVSLITRGCPDRALVEVNESTGKSINGEIDALTTVIADRENDILKANKGKRHHDEVKMKLSSIKMQTEKSKWIFRKFEEIKKAEENLRALVAEFNNVPNLGSIAPMIERIAEGFSELEECLAEVQESRDAELGAAQSAIEEEKIALEKTMTTVDKVKEFNEEYREKIREYQEKLKNGEAEVARLVDVAKGQEDELKLKQDRLSEKRSAFSSLVGRLEAGKSVKETAKENALELQEQMASLQETAKQDAHKDVLELRAVCKETICQITDTTAKLQIERNFEKDRAEGRQKLNARNIENAQNDIDNAEELGNNLDHLTDELEIYKKECEMYSSTKTDLEQGGNETALQYSEVIAPEIEKGGSVPQDMSLQAILDCVPLEAVKAKEKKARYHKEAESFRGQIVRRLQREVDGMKLMEGFVAEEPAPPTEEHIVPPDASSSESGEDSDGENKMMPHVNDEDDDDRGSMKSFVSTSSTQYSFVHVSQDESLGYEPPSGKGAEDESPADLASLGGDGSKDADGSD